MGATTTCCDLREYETNFSKKIMKMTPSAKRLPKILLFLILRDRDVEIPARKLAHLSLSLSLPRKIQRRIRFSIRASTTVFYLMAGNSFRIFTKQSV